MEEFKDQAALMQLLPIPEEWMQRVRVIPTIEEMRAYVMIPSGRIGKHIDVPVPPIDYVYTESEHNQGTEPRTERRNDAPSRSGKLSSKSSNSTMPPLKKYFLILLVIFIGGLVIGCLSTIAYFIFKYNIFHG